MDLKSILEREQTHSNGSKRTMSWVRITEEQCEDGEGADDDVMLLQGRQYRDKSGVLHDLKIEDLMLHVEVLKGDPVEADTNCDSKFMMDSIDEIGIAIRNSFHWVDRDVPIILFMDNAGGHGTETNHLDLGFWASLQSYVEHLHRLRRMEKNALARSVREAFNLIDGFRVLGNIAQRWEIVMDLIIKGNGTNDLVEMNRGLKKSLVDQQLPNVNPEADELLEEDTDSIGGVPVEL